MIDKSTLHVLVVDDEEAFRSLLPLFLKKMGHSCVVASDGFEALDKIRNGAFDLVISDIKMQGKDGLALMDEVKKHFCGPGFHHHHRPCIRILV
ncbi:MAG: response regulator [Syntrophobacteraceae bacterium]